MIYYLEVIIPNTISNPIVTVTKQAKIVTAFINQIAIENNLLNNLVIITLQNLHNIQHILLGL